MSDPDWLVKQNARIEAARGPFETLVLGRLGLDNRSGTRTGRMFNKVRSALWALQEWRQVNNQQQRQEDVVNLAIRITAAELAAQLAESAAGRPDLDENTIAWVLAGLRCKATPFCEGCNACFTVTAPNRETPTFGLPR